MKAIHVSWVLLLSGLGATLTALSQALAGHTDPVALWGGITAILSAFAIPVTSK